MVSEVRNSVSARLKVTVFIFSSRQECKNEAEVK